MTTQQTIVPQIIIDTAKKAVKSLDVTKSVYYIILPDGTVLDNSNGTIQAAVAKPDRTRTAGKMPHGTMAKTYGPTLLAMEIGDVVCLRLTQEMAAAGVTLDNVRSAVSPIAVKNWGKDSHKSHVNMKDNCLEILRVA